MQTKTYGAYTAYFHRKGGNTQHTFSFAFVRFRVRAKTITFFRRN